jgi:hypothetical protein
MRGYEQSSREVCIRARKELARLQSHYAAVDTNHFSAWLSVGALVIALDNLLVQSLEAYARTFLLSSAKSSILKPDFVGKDWAGRDFDDVVLSIFRQGKVNEILAAGQPISALPPYTMKKPNEIRRLFSTVLTSQSADFDAATAANFAIFSEIKAFRNFYAHKCEATARKLKSSVADMRGRTGRHPDALIMQRRSRNRLPLFEVWAAQLDEFYSIAGGW